MTSGLEKGAHLWTMGFSFLTLPPPPSMEGKKRGMKPVPVVYTEQEPDTPQLEKPTSKTAILTPAGCAMDGPHLSKTKFTSQGQALPAPVGLHRLRKMEALGTRLSE